MSANFLPAILGGGYLVFFWGGRGLIYFYVKYRQGTPKNLCDKDFAELSGELSGAIGLKTLVLLRFFGFGVLFWPFYFYGRRDFLSNGLTRCFSR